MFSSLLPKPKHCSYDTIKVMLPKASQASSALVVPFSNTDSHKKVTNLHSSGNALGEVFVDANGFVDVGKTLASIDGDGGVQTSYDDTIPLKVKYPNLRHHFPRYTLENCPDDSLATCVAETKKVIDDILFKAENGEVSTDEPTFVTFTPSSLTENDARGRTLEIRNFKEDPLLPPKFKLRKNREKEPLPPPPILKAAPTEKITKEIKDKWHIPSAVSNWKNNQGFAIALDKRVHAASGGSASEGPSINIEKFGQLSLALENADKQARSELAARNEQRKQIALKEQAEKEKKLKELLDRSRRHSGKRTGNSHDYDGAKRYRAA
ncbi:hypothetical protein METBIDRAFT_35647 [Metschnikowia bicuspidata var. bicuspidata NRRL YB-4993]|uniref:Pre-mRNA-processing protein 45 n=1 Tax=Metschnikowia bicuspidata var. bicuspidata NRRL YB-4993 TaxID=869754 RepID=A0A1A0HJM0_9ASCO|nr:hypothetical protein METBIDRAFT_35647 [Metschnikowia bicuspidata var. bicuspidata NRRL YB-4993]OBA24210.1 hypothetical protein METBIDRAFT_35647 [Metschnikowia bicuspidata var. bicuspidata NRRL YB-4993]